MSKVAPLKLALLLLALAAAPIGSILARAETLPEEREGGSVGTTMLFVSEPGSESYRLGTTQRRLEPTLYPQRPHLPFGLELKPGLTFSPPLVVKARIALSLLQRWQLEGG